MGASYTAVLDRIVEAESGGERASESEAGGGDETEPSSEDQTDHEADADREPQRDRVELAVLLLEADGEVVDERTVPVDRLPEDGAHEGAVLEVVVADDEDETENEAEVEAGTLLEISYEPEQERDRRDRAQDRFDRLSERLSDE